MGSSLLIVAGRERGREMFARVRSLGLPVEGCTPRELNRRVRSETPPSAILLSAGDTDPGITLAALRRTRVGASIPVVVFGPPGGGAAGSLDAVLDLGGDAFVAEPVLAAELKEVLEEMLGPMAEGTVEELRPDAHRGDEAPSFRPPPSLRVAGERLEGDYDPEASAADNLRHLPVTTPERTEVLPPDSRANSSQPEDGQLLADEDQPDDLSSEGPDARAPMGELHATLDRLEARLRHRESPEAGDARADQFGELDEFGLDEIPDVEPDGATLEGLDKTSPETAPVAPVSRPRAPESRARGFDSPSSSFSSAGPPASSPREEESFTDLEVLREARESRPPASEIRGRSYEGAERSAVLHPRRPPRSHAPESQAASVPTRPPSRGPASGFASAASPASEEGSLERSPLPELLWSLHERRYSGRLRVERARAERDLWFVDGELHFVRSRVASERLVDSLLRRGVLTRAQYETARRLAAKEPRRAGQLLMDAGFIKPGELARLVQDHLARLLEACFGPEGGRWSLHPGESVHEEIVVERSLLRVILDGVRTRLDRAALQGRLGARVLRPRLAGEFTSVSKREAAIVDLEQGLALLPEEGEWLRAFDGKHGVADLLDIYDDELGLMALTYALLVGGRVLMLGEGESAAPARDPAQIDAERIAERLRMAREEDYFLLLGVGRDASRAAVRGAYQQLFETFAGQNLEDETRSGQVHELLELRAALEEARDILIDDAMRSAYLAHLDVDESAV